MDWTSDLVGGYDTSGNYPTRAMCGYFLNSTSTLPTLLSGYTLSGNSSKTLIVRTIPLNDEYSREPMYGNGSIYFKTLRHKILDFLVVATIDRSSASIHRKERPVAQECVLSWYVKTMESFYAWGNYEERMIDNFSKTTAGPWPWVSTPFRTQSGNNGTDI